MSLKFPAAAAAVLALLVAGCGGSSHSATMTMDHGQTMTPGGVDRAFVAAMIPHHESAVAMARIARTHGQSALVKELADDMVRTQTAEITQMRARDAALARGGTKRGNLGVAHDMMGMSMDPSMLKHASPFDPAFLRMMIPHHQGAIVMAEAELAHGTDPQLRVLARRIIAAQRDEIAQMREHLAR